MDRRDAKIRVIRFVLVVSVFGLAAAVALAHTGLVIAELLVIGLLAWMIHRLRTGRPPRR